MKKILILLLITLSLTTYAQKNYSIERPLYLGTVNAGSAADSVLVRGADKIVKFVPRSAFGGGSGGAQNLNDVLINGNSSSQSIFINDPGNGTIGVTPTKIIGSNLNGQNNIILTDRYESGDANYSFNPDKLPGDYVIATLDDIIGLQSISGELVDTSDSLNPVIMTPTLDQVLATTTFTNKQIRINDKFNSSQLYLAGNTLSFSSISDPTNGGSLIMKQGLSEGKWMGSLTKTNGNSILRFIIPNGLEYSSANFSLPDDKPSGDYIVATLDDLKLKEYTVSTLPAGTKGDVAYVNDAASPAPLATVVGGGSSVVRVFYNGSNWIVQ